MGVVGLIRNNVAILPAILLPAHDGMTGMPAFQNNAGRRPTQPSECQIHLEMSHASIHWRFILITTLVYIKLIESAKSVRMPKEENVILRGFRI